MATKKKSRTLFLSDEDWMLMVSQAEAAGFGPRGVSQHLAKQAQEAAAGDAE